jgi:DNA polymerase-3 subunit gamma/tau
VEFTELLARMQWICTQEGIQADAETLSVLAQSGEGSVRDALSALDQAIACCGATLKADEVRNLLGLYSLDTLGDVTRALEAGDSRRMLEIVQDLERNGHNLQHFCRELSRYFRNLVVAKVAGAGSRLIAASDAEQERLHRTASAFTEEDLTRYLQLTLELYREMQASLQPRLHLEMGLLRLVYAGRLAPIEEALAGLNSTPPPAPASGPSGGSPSRASSAQSAPAQTAPLRDSPPAQASVGNPPADLSAAVKLQTGSEESLKARLLRALTEQ